MADNKSSGGCLTQALGVVLIFVALSMIWSDNSDDDDIVKAKDQKIETTEQIDIVPPLSEQISDWGFSDINSATIALEACGLTDLRNCELTDDNGPPSFLKSYRLVYDDDRTVVITLENGSLYYIGVNGTDIYTVDTGVIMSLMDVHIPEKDISLEKRTIMQYLAEEGVKLYLNYPSTAKFDYWSWRYSRSDNNYAISGKVTASNAFGVPSDMYFHVYFIRDPETDKLDYSQITLNGSVVFDAD